MMSALFTTENTKSNSNTVAEANCEMSPDRIRITISTKISPMATWGVRRTGWMMERACATRARGDRGEARARDGETHDMGKQTVAIGALRYIGGATRTRVA